MSLVDGRLSETSKKEWESVPRDANRCSLALRLAYFTTRILSSFDILDHVDTETVETVFYSLPLALQLIDDDLSIENSNGVTGMELEEQREDYMETVNDGRKVISQWIHSGSQLATGESVSSKLSSFWESKLDGLSGTSPMDYRIGEAFVRITASAGSKTKSSEEVAKLCKDVRTANAIRSASWLAALRHSVISNPAGTRLCNELVADSTGLKTQDKKNDGEYARHSRLC